MKANWISKIGLLAVLFLLAACQGAPAQQTVESPTAQPIGLPNPASVYCEEQGGELEIRTGADGGQYGVCLFEDGSECDEWAYFREECQPGEMDAAPAPQQVQTYVNEPYGFLFNMQTEDYTVEGYDHYTLFKQGSVTLFVGYRWFDEHLVESLPEPADAKLTKAGEIVPVLGYELPSVLLLKDDLVQGVRYQPFQAGDLVMNIWLETSGEALSAAEMEEANAIVSSFALLSGEAVQVQAFE